MMVQITHLGRRGEPYATNWLPTIGPSAIRETLHRSFPKEMDEHDIDRVVKATAPRPSLPRRRPRRHRECSPAGI